MKPLTVRWTIGDVSRRGFEALRLSVWGARQAFGPRARYVICFNSVSPDDLWARTGPLPADVQLRDAGRDVPAFLSHRLDRRMAEGSAWKFAPLRVTPDRWELCLDNDCILWAVPPAVGAWLADPRRDACLLAEDVRPCFGRFADLSGPEPRNSGLRGMGPDFDVDGALRRVLARRPGTLTSELDEQGLQVAALAHAPMHVVRIDHVSICSPFPPHRPSLGRCGAHFVGLNARCLGWELRGRPASEWTAEHFDRHRAALYERVGITPA